MPLGNGTTRNYVRLLIGPLQRRRRPLPPARTGGRRTLAVAEANSEVRVNCEDEKRIKRIIQIKLTPLLFIHAYALSLERET